MLNRIIAAALKSRAVVLAAALLVALYGGYLAHRMPIDVLPDLNRPTVTVITEGHGMAPEDVERQITLPLELSLNGATGVTRVRSSSGLGLSVVQVEFEWGAEIFRSRQIVQERLQLVQAQLPADAQPQMAPISSIMGQIQLIGIRSTDPDADVSELRAMVDGRLKPRLRSVPGVAQIVSIGGAPRQLQVIADADKLRVFAVSMEELAEAVRAANLNASGGILNQGTKAPVVTVSGRITEARQLKDAIVREDPVRPIRISDVARVEFGPAAIRTGEAGIDGNPGVILVIFKQPNVDTVGLTDRINRELEELQGTLPQGVTVVNDLFQQAQFIHRAVGNVEDAVRDGAILVVIVLFLFLMNLRTTLITLTALPLSVAITALVFAAFGLTINTMTLGGLAVAIGALVDDAIVDVENVFRRLRQNVQLKKPRSALAVVFTASMEVRSPIVIGTLLVIVVYLPLFFLTGIEGRLFAPIGLAYIISILASLAVSLTVTPVLCYYLLGRSVRLEHGEDAWLVRKLKALTAHAIRFSLAFPVHIAGALLGCVLISCLLLATRGSEFLPAFNEGSYQVNLILPPGTGLHASDQYGRRMEHIILQVDGVAHVGRRSGRAEGDEHAEGVNVSEAIVTIKPDSPRSRSEILAEIRERLADELPGVTTAVEQPLAHLLSHMLSGVYAQVAIKISGPDLDVLRKTAQETEAALKAIPGVKDLHVEQQVLVEQVEVVPDRERLARHGLTVLEMGQTVELALGGEEVSQMLVGQVSYPIVVRLEEKDRRDLDALRALQVRTQAGSRLRLGDVAEVRIGRTPNNINRENVSRRIVVQHNVGDRSLGEVVADVERALEPIRAKLAAQPGYSLKVSGQFEAQAEATRMIFALSFVSLAAMFLILYLHFRSVNLSLQVLLSIPMAFVGAVVYLVLSRQDISVATLVGLVSLGGIAARNAILLLDHYIHLMHEEGEGFSHEMIVRAGQERMVPVLMTALCAGIALVPLALAPDEPGREILYPVATVILGGLLSSTILEFLLTPGVFWIVGRNDAERLARARPKKDRAAEAMAAEFEAEAPAEAVAAQNPGGVSHA
ncbi:MAG: efflux RND transporter permease subunit [Planctomycetes bacterium]|nr:efflux RND transporter permease subunit [Planctomycetota bacterium]